VSTLATYSVTSGAAVKIVDSGSGNVFAKVSALGTAIYLGADNTVTVATGVPLDPRGELFQFTADHEIWAIAKSDTASVRVLSWV
jgi:hypothetical protein